MSILITGDLHGGSGIDKISRLVNNATWSSFVQEITHLICLGDWGAIWNDEPTWVTEEFRLLAIYDQHPWETLVVLGNHEGYQRISQLPWTIRHGAPVQRVSEKVFVLQNGNVYTVLGVRFFVFGGAMSTDKANRLSGVDWWPEEMPTQDDCARGIQSLETHQGVVDYVLTHTCPDEIALRFSELDQIFAEKALDPTCKDLSLLREKLSHFRAWLFGHFHEDLSWDEYHCLFENFFLIKVLGLEPTLSKVPLPP